MLGNRVVKKKTTPTIDGDKYPAASIAAAEKGGFIEKVADKKAKTAGSGEDKGKSVGDDEDKTKTTGSGQATKKQE